MKPLSPDDTIQGTSPTTRIELDKTLNSIFRFPGPLLVLRGKNSKVCVFVIEYIIDLCKNGQFLHSLLSHTGLGISSWTEWSTIQGVYRLSNFKIGRARSARPISNYEHDYSLNCTTRCPITN